MKTLFLPLLLLVASVVTGCSSTSQVVVGSPRSPRSPDQVKIYLHAPKNFEEIALLNTSSKNSWAVTDQGKMDKAVARLKEEAAKLGANGVLLRETGSQEAGSLSTNVVTANGHHSSVTALGTGVAVPVLDKTATGVAIYVVEE